MDKTQDLESGQSAPDVKYIKYCHLEGPRPQDLPKQYCCRAMQERV